MTSNRFFVNEKTVKRNGTTAIYAIVHIENKTLKINTEVSVSLNQWDKINGRIMGNDKDTKDSNLTIDRCLAAINEIFVRYRLQSKKLTADLFLREYHNPTHYVDFYVWLDKKISERIQNKEIGHVSGKHHRVLQNKLKEFKSELSFAEIDLNFITSFRNWCRISKNNNANTIHKTFGYFKAYLNIAKREEIISINPLENFPLRRIEVQRSYLTENQLIKFAEIYKSGEIPENLQNTLRHFLFMCYTGLRISDFRRIKKENADENTLSFVPHKTNSRKLLEIHVPLINQAQVLIADENSDTDYIFNPISDQKMNSHLKNIAGIAGIKKKITNHTARHTFASIFLEKTSDLVTLQRLLGHSDIKETMIYVHTSKTKINSQMMTFGDLLNT